MHRCVRALLPRHPHRAATCVSTRVQVRTFAKKKEAFIDETINMTEEEREQYLMKKKQAQGGGKHKKKRKANPEDKLTARDPKAEGDMKKKWSVCALFFCALFLK